jgi:hypothetical protein
MSISDILLFLATELQSKAVSLSKQGHFQINNIDGIIYYFTFTITSYSFNSSICSSKETFNELENPCGYVSSYNNKIQIEIKERGA